MLRAKLLGYSTGRREVVKGERPFLATNKTKQNKMNTCVKSTLS